MHKTSKARFWPRLSGTSLQHLLRCSRLFRKRYALGIRNSGLGLKTIVSATPTNCSLRSTHTLLSTLFDRAVVFLRARANENYRPTRSNGKTQSCMKRLLNQKFLVFTYYKLPNLDNRISDPDQLLTQVPSLFFITLE